MNDPTHQVGKSYYKSAGEIESLIQRFESCRLKPSDMTHPAHLAISVWYLSRFSAVDGAERIRKNLIRFIRRHGLKRYNETITLFWIKLTGRFLENVESARPVNDLANDLITRFGNSEVIFDYYSRNRLFSQEAQAGWAEPDLKPLDF
ncbi:MAG TPA: hypothetical protein VF762_13860 [Blastocatellia bacterium]|jgi:hypothetical protein